MDNKPALKSKRVFGALLSAAVLMACVMCRGLIEHSVTPEVLMTLAAAFGGTVSLQVGTHGAADIRRAGRPEE